MGCYLSVPDDKVYVTEGRGNNYTYATASCQGWRREQEDAEDCLPSFDGDASLFVLCDGHGGAEVAKYTVEHLPDFIKKHSLYKEGKYEEALESAFIDFDALLRTDEVMAELERLSMEHENNKVIDEDANDINDPKKSDTETPQPCSSTGASSSTKNGNSSVVDDVDAETLKREAKVPIRKLIDEYSATGSLDQAKRNLLNSIYNASPVVKSKRETDENGGSNAKPEAEATEITDQPGPSSSKSTEPAESKVELEPEQGSSSSSSSNPPASINKTLIDQMLRRYFPDDGEEDSSDDSEYDAERSNVEDGDDEEDDDRTSSEGKKLRRKRYQRLPGYSAADESSTEDSRSSGSCDDLDDEDDDDDEEEDEEEDEDDEEADNEEEEDEEEEGLEESISPFFLQGARPNMRAHKPGMDSGCTVVVALVKENKLYVASAGDSRCIVVMRNGVCKPMSFDHKPEDPIERKRIAKVGGRVTDGRVNGGLNLSRAFGDFTYKRADLSAKDQMITPCPDVKTADLDPKEVEYLFLACDGIWNSMKNQEVAKFIKKTASAVDNNLIEVCVSLFRTCIAPKTDGDGTGCDNMTCILVKYDDPNEVKSTESDLKEKSTTDSNNIGTPDGATQKRLIHDESSDMPTKRRCLRL